jgi:thymidylate kinase
MKKPVVIETRPLSDAKEKRSERARPNVPARVRNLLRLKQQQSGGSIPAEIPPDARVIVIEGIAGSGKDTLQAYLKEKLKGRDVYDFSEGELLHSWKHFPIPGILKLRVSFLTQFVKYLKVMVEKDKNAVFLLNRFHLSTYVTTVLRQPELRKEYEELIDVLRTLPIHVFILQLDESEIEQRTLHAERSSAWRKLQQQIVAKDGFDNKVEKYTAQQRLMINAAESHRIPFSIVKLPHVGGRSPGRGVIAFEEKSKPPAQVSRKV